ncbi:uncharacterized protein [Dendrobates tinctorius]|uniref:uncharacterized protein isoform X2 n=1 Tax=Dendrobates tinctorius TaxID=92724 RepID=UPI003CC95DF4
MDKEQNEITKRLLNFTLEMIYLLTGEDYTIVKKTSDCVTPASRLNESGGRSLITDPPPHSPIHERSNKKILELTNKIIELLTGEVSGRHRLFLHGGVGVSRRTQGSVRERHDGGRPAPHITRDQNEPIGEISYCCPAPAGRSQRAHCTCTSHFLPRRRRRWTELEGRGTLQMDPGGETHQRDCPVLCTPRIVQRRITTSQRVIRSWL